MCLSLQAARISALNQQAQQHLQQKRAQTRQLAVSCPLDSVVQLSPGLVCMHNMNQTIYSTSCMQAARSQRCWCGDTASVLEALHVAWHQLMLPFLRALSQCMVSWAVCAAPPCGKTTHGRC